MSDAQLEMFNRLVQVPEDQPTAQLFLDCIRDDYPQGRQIRSRLIPTAQRHRLDAVAARAGLKTLAPGCCRCVTVFELDRTRLPRHTLLVTYVGGKGTRTSPQGRAVAERWLRREGFDCPDDEASVGAAGCDAGHFSGNSATLADTLSWISREARQRAAPDLIPTADLAERDGVWVLDPVDDIDVKLKDLPVVRGESCKLLVAKGQALPSADHENQVVRCATLDDAVGLVLPNMEWIEHPALGIRLQPRQKTGRRDQLTWALALGAALVSIILLQIGAWQELRCPSNHPGGIFPGWGAPNSVRALVNSAIASAIVGVGFAAWGAVFVRRPMRARTFWVLAPLIGLLLAAVGYWLLAAGVATPGGVVGDRNAHTQIVKALLIVFLLVELLVWPALHAAAWQDIYEHTLRRRAAACTPKDAYPRGGAILRSTGRVVCVCSSGLIGLGCLQWASWKYAETGRGDLWRGTHMVAQGLLLTLLAGFGWYLTYRTERRRDAQASRRLQGEEKDSPPDS